MTKKISNKRKQKTKRFRKKIVRTKRKKIVRTKRKKIVRRKKNSRKRGGAGPPLPQISQRAVVIQEFIPDEGSSFIPVESGEHVIVLHAPLLNPYWYIRKEDGREGYVPEVVLRRVEFPVEGNPRSATLSGASAPPRGRCWQAGRENRRGLSRSSRPQNVSSFASHHNMPRGPPSSWAAGASRQDLGRGSRPMWGVGRSLAFGHDMPRALAPPQHPRPSHSWSAADLDALSDSSSDDSGVDSEMQGDPAAMQNDVQGGVQGDVQGGVQGDVQGGV